MQQSELNSILDRFPDWEYNPKQRTFSGYFPISDGDRYYLEMDVTPFPDRFPRVLELNERIPPIANRHVNKDGTLCFASPLDTELALINQIKSITDFIDLILIPYLENNSYFELNKKYKFGERLHNLIDAEFHSYQDQLDLGNAGITLNTIKSLKDRVKIRPNDKCYCGSGIKIKDCKDHQERYKKLRDSRLHNRIVKDYQMMEKVAQEVLSEAKHNHK